LDIGNRTKKEPEVNPLRLIFLEQLILTNSFFKKDGRA